jgi:hypothetical protein
MSNKLNREVGEIKVSLKDLIGRVDRGFSGINTRLDRQNTIIAKHEEKLIRLSEWQRKVDERHKNPFDRGIGGIFLGLLRLFK